MAQENSYSGNSITNDTIKTLVAFCSILMNQQKKVDRPITNDVKSECTANLENCIEARDSLPLPGVLTVNELAELLSISKPTAHKLVKQDGFPSFRIGKSIRINRRMLQEWMDRQCAESKGAA